MSARKLSRRHFLTSAATCTVGIVAAACQPKVVEKIVKETVVVEKPVEKVVEKVVKETVMVAGTPQVVEKVVKEVVKETVVVEKAVKETVTIQPVIMAYYWDDALKALLPNFLERFPYIKVEPIEVPGWGDYPVKLAAMHAAGDLGDTVEYDMGWEFMEWAHKGMIRPIENLVEATGFDLDMFYPAGIESCSFKGHVIAIPQDTHPGCCAPYYNADMTLEAGLELPSNDWDYDEFIEYCLKMTQDTDKDGKTDIYAYAAHSLIKGLYPRLRANGGTMYDEECRHCLYNSEPGVQTLRQAYDLFQTYKVHPMPGGEAADALYRSGKMWMRLMTPTHIMSMTTATKDLFRTEAVVMPKSVETGKIGTATTGIGYCMTTLTKHPEETWEFLQWVGSKWYGMAGFNGGFTTPGGRKDTWGDPSAAEKWPFSQEIAKILEISEAYEIPWNYRHREIQRVFGEVESVMYLGEVGPEEAADTIVTRIDEILDEPVL